MKSIIHYSSVSLLFCMVASIVMYLVASFENGEFERIERLIIAFVIIFAIVIAFSSAILFARAIVFLCVIIYNLIKRS